jgi:hypothetical protein
MQTPDTHRTEGQKLKLTGERPVMKGSFENGNGWQEVIFDSPAKGRYLCIEARDVHKGWDMACIAELYILDKDGNRISREPWTVEYADSENVTDGNYTADKIFDLQESTYWSTEEDRRFPHSIVIDLGDIHEISGIQYLPRMESEVPGAIRKYRIYIKEEAFAL